MLPEIRIPLDRKCVSNETADAVVFSGSVGQVIGLAAHELKKRGSDLCLAGTKDSLHELAVSGKGLQQLQELIQTPAMQLLLQAADPEETRLVSMDQSTLGLTKAVEQTRRMNVLDKYIVQARNRGDIQGARRLREQQQISQGKVLYNLRKVATNIPGNTLEGKLRGYIGNIIDTMPKVVPVTHQISQAESL